MATRKTDGKQIFEHFGFDGDRYDTYRADYMTESCGCGLLWNRGNGKEANDELVAVFGLAVGASSLRLISEPKHSKKKK